MRSRTLPGIAFCRSRNRYQILEGGQCTPGGERVVDEPVRDVVIEIDRAQLPNELIDIERRAQVAGGERGQKRTPLRLQCHQALPDRVVVSGVVELEETSSDGTPSAQTGLLGPGQPPFEDGAEPRESLRRFHGRLDDGRLADAHRFVEQPQLHFGFRSEVREQTALGESGLCGEHAERDTAEAASGEEVEPSSHDSISGVLHDIVVLLSLS